MKIKSIEPTPSPNTMKVILDQELPMGKSHNYKKKAPAETPKIIQDILQIEGINGVYHVADFLAIERNAKYDWMDLLTQVRKAFGENPTDLKTDEKKVNDHFGEIKVEVQTFKDIPLQVKLTDASTEKRFGMPDYFLKARERAQLPEDNYIFLRKWKDHGVRYGDFEEIGHEVVEELIAAFPDERLESLVKRAQTKEMKPVRIHRKITLEDLDQQDWKIRYQSIEQMEDPTVEDLPVLEKGLTDEKVSIRRLITAYLGMIKDNAVLPLLFKALKDKAVIVRRTAGDCLSDLGFKEAQEKMTEALKDESKLVRWRAAMFLFEVGDEAVLPSLKSAQDDPEFEVRLQVKMAIERIEGGMEAKGSVWKQMTDSRRSLQ
ncbi:MAG: conserved virulence factor C family protein [Bacillota bacterium]|nr:conserved virulence factor C family protein [Bacillota bacterium]